MPWDVPYFFLYILLGGEIYDFVLYIKLMPLAQLYVYNVYFRSILFLNSSKFKLLFPYTFVKLCSHYDFSSSYVHLVNNEIRFLVLQKYD